MMPELKLGLYRQVHRLGCRHQGSAQILAPKNHYHLPTMALRVYEVFLVSQAC